MPTSVTISAAVRRQSLRDQPALRYLFPIPDFLDSQQPIETKSDVDAYLSRLEKISTLLDNDSEVARQDVVLGVIPPDFALDKATTQLTTLRAVNADKSVMHSPSPAARRRGTFPATMARRPRRSFRSPSIPRSTGRSRSSRRCGRRHARRGVWKLPNGGQYYADSVLFWTTSTMSPREIHETGLTWWQTTPRASIPT